MELLEIDNRLRGIHIIHTTYLVLTYEVPWVIEPAQQLMCRFPPKSMKMQAVWKSELKS